MCGTAGGGEEQALHALASDSEANTASLYCMMVERNPAKSNSKNCRMHVLFMSSERSCFWSAPGKARWAVNLASCLQRTLRSTECTITVALGTAAA